MMVTGNVSQLTGHHILLRRGSLACQSAHGNPIQTLEQWKKATWSKSCFLLYHMGGWVRGQPGTCVPSTWGSEDTWTNSLLIEEREQLEKQKYIFEQHIINGKRQNIIKKTCLAIATGITPFIDRILNEVNKLISKGFINRNDVKKEKFTYIDELVTKINEYNDILAIWIKMKQGALKLNIETFDLDDLFEIIGKGKRTFESKKQKLTI